MAELSQFECRYFARPTITRCVIGGRPPGYVQAAAFHGA